MSVIEVKQLTKVFKISKKEPGFGGADILVFNRYQKYSVIYGLPKSTVK